MWHICFTWTRLVKFIYKHQHLRYTLNCARGKQCESEPKIIPPQTYFRSKNRNFLRKTAFFVRKTKGSFSSIWFNLKCESKINYLKSVESCNILKHSFQLFTLMERHDVITSADTFPANKYTWHWGLTGQFLHVSLDLVHIRPSLYLKDLNVLGVDGVFVQGSLGRKFILIKTKPWSTNRILAKYSDFLIPLSLHPNIVCFLYFKFRLNNSNLL